MSTDLIIIHIGFILALVVSVWYSGFKRGRSDMCEQFLEDGFIDSKELLSFYKELNK